jgi:organic radical activating enzyme
MIINLANYAQYLVPVPRPFGRSLPHRTLIFGVKYSRHTRCCIREFARVSIEPQRRSTPLAGTMVSTRVLSTAVVCATSAFRAVMPFHLQSGVWGGRSGSSVTDSALVAHLSHAPPSSSSLAAVRGRGRDANATALGAPAFGQEIRIPASVLAPDATPLGNVRDPRLHEECPRSGVSTTPASLVPLDDHETTRTASSAMDQSYESKSTLRTGSHALVISNDASKDAATGRPSLKSLIRSVNYFISRKCNYSCQFCFHTQKTTHHLTLGQAEAGLKLLRQAGCEKINFAGGEPFVHASLLGQLCRLSHQMGLAVSIISNGSLITDKWMKEYGQYVDVLGVSVDSFVPETNGMIGRGGDANNRHVDRILRVRDMCAEHSIKFKMNTVVCSLNWCEDMSRRVLELRPDR